MTQGNLAPKYRGIPRHEHNRYQHKHNNVDVKLIQLHRKHQLKGAQSLGLNRVERAVLVIGLILTVGLMLTLVSIKITNDVYQHQMITVNATVSKYHNLNNNSRQKISDLENTNRLQSIAHHNHLTFSSHAVRNVK